MKMTYMCFCEEEYAKSTIICNCCFCNAGICNYENLRYIDDSLYCKSCFKIIRKKKNRKRRRHKNRKER